VADGMTQTKHDPDSELIGLGISNIVCPFFGGIAATGAIARTATNIRFGARSPISAMVHAFFALLAILLFAPYVSFLPMAALAALLVLVAYNMSEIHNFVHIAKVAPRSDVAVLFTCFVLTVAFDMVVGVTVGVFLAVLFFMNRMTRATFGRIRVEGEFHPYGKKLPHTIVLYEIVGPLFFGAAEKAVNEIDTIGDDAKVVIFDLEDVPVIDVTGLVAFETAVERLAKHNRVVFIAGASEKPREILLTSRFLKSEKVKFVDSVELAVQGAQAVLA
jgi:SulP family sulfate permease